MEMISWTRPPSWIKKIYDKSIWNCATPGCITLTFDDGPGSATKEILSWADKHKKKLLFFVLPDRALRYCDLIQETAKNGHIIGTHFLQHRSHLFVNKRQFQNELKCSVETIENIIQKPVKYCRAPYGRLFPWQESWICELGMTHVFWSLDTQDSHHQSHTTIKTKLRKNVQAGDIILMHDGQNYYTKIIQILDYIVKDLGFSISETLSSL